MNNYFATVVPGLEQLLIEEINSQLKDIKIMGTSRGKVFMQTSINADLLKTLKIANNLYLIITRLEVGIHRSDLNHLRDQIFQLNLKPYLRKAHFYVNASRKGGHTYSRYEAAQAAMDGIKKRFPHKKVSMTNHHEVEFRLDIEDYEALFSLKLTEATFRFRHNQRSFSAASLTPTVAHAMVRLSDPEEKDVFIDPCCGSGTILSERLLYPFTFVGGGDIDNNALAVARENLKDTFAEVIQWDACKLNLEDDSIHKVATNLPFGRQISFGSETNEVNRGILTEISRVLTHGGTLVVLSESWDEILQVAESLDLLLLKSYPLSLKGLHPTIYVFKKI
ncbi:methyltransferase [Erysipelothrix anatis]|jgi:tRNA (guanine6-N2)-methyltransferase|uniref:methyltransferase n=1 Tax=Erysipelothrix anatis TaxID=2683713 RepID=UPI001409CD89|nr:methyltransferase domain-containing protein [Erysipelothrix anatis]